jgi:hypothetical protein
MYNLGSVLIEAGPTKNDLSIVAAIAELFFSFCLIDIKFGGCRAILQLDRRAARNVPEMGLKKDETLLEDDQEANNVPRSRISNETLTDFEEDFLSRRRQYWRH